MTRPGPLALYGVLLVSACGGADPDATAPYGLSARETPTTVAFTADTGADADIAVINAYPHLQFDQPVDFADVPGSHHAVVAEHTGTLRVFERRADVTDADLFADLRDRVRYDGNEQGLVRLAFDPAYADNGRVYLVYAGRQADDPQRCTPYCSVLSRFTRDPQQPLRLDPDSEQRLLVVPQPGWGHNLGNLLFGPDGYLYVGAGDGGFSEPPLAHAQDRSSLLGSVLRLDVSGDDGYRIPPDNPFVGVGQEAEGVIGAGQPVRTELWAFGLRNPHRFSIDPITGAMWLGDVGQADVEEINRIVPGGNYGWPMFEGSQYKGGPDGGHPADQLRAPALEYRHWDGVSITLGFVYRGTALPSLYQHLLYGDFTVGKLWAAPLTAADGLGEPVLLSESLGGFSLASFTEIDGEAYLVNLGRGIIQKLVEGPGDDQVRVPQTLSATGLFRDLASLTPAPGLIPYGVNMPLWSDGTEKQRWMALPAGTHLTSVAADRWDFPLGTVLVKHFELDLDRLQDGPLRRLETRVLVHTVRGWIGYTYRWNDAQTDASLVYGRHTETLAVATAAGTVNQTYDYPSTADCATCHNASAGHVLGLRSSQLNGDFAYPLAVDNQLRTLDHIGVFDPPLAPPDHAPRWPAPDDAVATIAARARAYLAANCAQCHNPDNTLPVTLNLRYSAEDAALNAIDVMPRNGDLGVDDARIIAPGDRHRSTLWLRMNRRGEGQMPPLATHVVDADAVALIGDWIDALSPR